MLVPSCQPPLCSACKLFRPRYHHQVYGDPNEPTHYSRDYKRHPLRKFVEGQRTGCLGCGLVLDAIEEWQPGWMKDHPEAEVLLSIHYSILSMGLYLPPSGDPILECTLFQSQGSSLNFLRQYPLNVCNRYPCAVRFLHISRDLHILRKLMESYPDEAILFDAGYYRRH